MSILRVVHVPISKSAVATEIANLTLATIRAAASSLKPLAAASEEEAELLFADLLLNRNKAERVNQDNQRHALRLQQQHDSRDYP